MTRLLFACLFAFLAVFAASADERPDYRGLVARIDAVLEQAGKDYAEGRADAAKQGVQDAYFQIFENLEGPIRVNISARRSRELESEFGAIRKLIVAGAPPAEVTARINAHVAALNETIPALEAGFVLKAEPVSPSAGATAPPPIAQAQAPALAPKIEPYWTNAVALVRGKLDAAIDAAASGKTAEARDLVTEAEFAYKNSLLETAMRRFVSQQQDRVFIESFARLRELVASGAPGDQRAAAQALTGELEDRLPGLPLVGVAEDEARNLPQETVDWAAVSDKVNVAVGQALGLAGAGDRSGAAERIQSAYFDIFEASGMENAVGARDATLKTDIEARFSKLVALVTASAAPEALAAEAQALKAGLGQATTLLQGQGDGLALFLYAFLIILREGFEAILIVTAIVAYLVKTGHGDKTGVIYNSIVVAVLASVATAVVLNYVFKASGVGRETLEGVTMLIAAAVLFFMSFWLISKAEAAKWSRFINEQVAGSLSKKSVWALWFTSFLAVYREGAEVVLFFQALAVGADRSGTIGLIAGFALGCLCLVVVYAVLRAGATRLPIGLFFKATGALLYVMSIVFVGKGVMELVEGKVLTPTLVPGVPEIPAIGLYPYLESLIPQALLILLSVGAYAVLKLRGPAPSPAADAPRR